MLGGVLPGGFGTQLWTFVTYALIHADWTHYGVNAGVAAAVRQRGGAAVRSAAGPGAFCAVTAAAGAAIAFATHAGEAVPVDRASAAISGTMAAAMRFAFQRGGPLSFWRTGEATDYRVPAIPLSGVARSARARLPGGVVWHQYVSSGSAGFL